MAKIDRPKKLTRVHKELLTKKGLVAKNWFLLVETETKLKLANKTTGKVKVLNKI